MGFSRLKIPEWAAISSFGGSPQPRDQTWFSVMLASSCYANGLSQAEQLRMIQLYYHNTKLVREVRSLKRSRWARRCWPLHRWGQEPARARTARCTYRTGLLPWPWSRCSGQGRGGHSAPIWRDCSPWSLCLSSFLLCPLKSSTRRVESPPKIKKITVSEGLRSFQETGGKFIAWLSFSGTRSSWLVAPFFHHWNQKCCLLGLPWQYTGWDSVHVLQGVWVWALVGE